MKDTRLRSALERILEAKRTDNYLVSNYNNTKKNPSNWKKYKNLKTPQLRKDSKIKLVKIKNKKSNQNPIMN